MDLLFSLKRRLVRIQYICRVHNQAWQAVNVIQRYGDFPELAAEDMSWMDSEKRRAAKDKSMDSDIASAKVQMLRTCPKET